MIEIVGEHINELNDADLRDLIGQLCEAELSSKGISTKGVTWGGHQDSKDGGVDVRVDITGDLDENGYIPRTNTIFQVKLPDMPPAAIKNEMRKKNELNPEIVELAKNSGAYIIVSANGTVADKFLNDRKVTMRNMLYDCVDSEKIKVDFYDRVRIASWVREFPAMILWVREKIGKPIFGWKPYGNWSNSNGDISEKYIIDDHVRIKNLSKRPQQDISVLDGINLMRNILHNPKSAIRLAGLSGVGKTRFLQALFDERIGEDALDSKHMIYTDIASEPTPSPMHFAEQCVALKKPLILAIDNCSVELHKELQKICSSTNSNVSLITVEYDVKGDRFEETDAFLLEPSSDDLIDQLINARYSDLDYMDISRITKLSGGNARIAIALASTIKKGETISYLEDSDIFKRLFIQRNTTNDELMRVAKACSLVYSFNITTSEDENMELKALSSLIDMPIERFYEFVCELKSRDLIQQRGEMRALLPPALANRLALEKLKETPTDTICRIFENCNSERLLKSLSKRLSYLHDSDEAKAIIKRWFEDNNILGDLSDLNKLLKEMLFNAVSVERESALTAIEKATCQTDFFISNIYAEAFVNLLYFIAYDANLFRRSVDLICSFINNNASSKIDLLKSLFYIERSGTHASLEQRLDYINSQIESDDNTKISLGIELLESALKSQNIPYPHLLSFDTYRKDFGYEPQNFDEVKKWFESFIQYSIKLILERADVAYRIKEILAKQFEGLWEAGLYDELEKATKQIIEKTEWNECWIIVKNMMFVDEDGQKMLNDTFQRLKQLEEMLKPTTLVDKVKVFVFSSNLFYECEDLVEIVYELGKDIASDLTCLYQILSDLLTRTKARDTLFYFGKGFADGSMQHVDSWTLFCENLVNINDSYCILLDFMKGFLYSINMQNSELYETLLDKILEDNSINFAYPYLQTSSALNLIGFERLIKSLICYDIPINSYGNLVYGNFTKSISDSNCCKLMRTIFNKKDGFSIVLQMFYFRFVHNYKSLDLRPRIAHNLGRELLISWISNFERFTIFLEDYKISKIIEFCYSKNIKSTIVIEFYQKFHSKLLVSRSLYSNYNLSLKTLAKIKPIEFLQVFISDCINIDYYVRYAIIERHLLSLISDEIIINWCNENKEVRFLNISKLIDPIKKEGELIRWTELAEYIINNVSNPIDVLEIFKNKLSPNSWSGSRALIIENRLVVISSLKKHSNKIISSWAIETEIEMIKHVNDVRIWEDERERSRYETFE